MPNSKLSSLSAVNRHYANDKNTFEYPFVTNEIIEGLNLLGKHQQLMLDILEQVKDFVKNRFELPE